ncbi:MAG: Cell division protein FtsK, partial [Verrucomicrobiales bacterium]|nr:Cell division protein FtsK [Verrucomicrobiales bacterium]
MKVYGDAEEEVSLSDLLGRLDRQIRSTDFHNLESVRALLIEAGQVEQAVADAEEQVGTELVQQAVETTDWAAKIFCALYFGIAPDVRPKPSPTSKQSACLKVKTPEGFAFYALYPEQYCTSTVRWAEQQRDKSAVVIGLRSIGTTLSAVINATLRLKGWDCTRVAVRASGHPFERTVELPDAPRAQWALVVDEGPGISGSSMAGVAQALERKGFAANQIVFFPAHENGPGNAASEKVRSWWERVESVTTRLADTKWSQSTLREQLIEASSELLPITADRDVRAPVLEDCSGGLWRWFAFRHEAQWPAVASQFERMKFLYRAESGSLLWKFLGLAPGRADSELASMRKRAKHTNSPAPLRMCNGFVAMPWIEGERLTSDRADEMLQTLARYIADSVQEPLARKKASESTRRIADMTAFNLREALGAGWPPSLDRFVRRFRPALHVPCYGDGRMAPHEWVRTSEAKVLKTDSVGHDCDHTLIGQQAVHWDVAGVIVEWGLNDAQVE